MPIVYRTDDLTRWGSGKGANLTASEVDLNFWQLLQIVAGISPEPPVSIEAFIVSGASFYVNLTDGSTLGPYALPVTSWTFRGAWSATTAYVQSDVVTESGACYLVLYTHTSAATFDPNANNGLGQNYYGLLTPGPQGVPAGGAIGQVLAKLSSTDYDTTWINNPVPAGGSTGEILRKASAADRDLEFAAPHNNPLGGLTNQVLTKLSETDDDYSWKYAPFQQMAFQLSTPYTLTIDDAWTVIAAAGNTITVPAESSVAFEDGTIVILYQNSASGVVIAADAGVTISTPANSVAELATIGAFAFLVKTSTNTWQLFGQLKPRDATGNMTGTQTVNLNSATASGRYFVTPTGNITFNLSTSAQKDLYFVFTTSGTTSFTITFGTNFTSQGTLATGVVSGKIFVVHFVCDGTKAYEVARLGPL